MAIMSKYCKAYALKDLKAYGKWMEKVPAAAEETKDDAYVYIHDNFIVTRGIFVDEAIVFDHVTDEWKEYCQSILGFDASKHQVGEAADIDEMSASVVAR